MMTAALRLFSDDDLRDTRADDIVRTVQSLLAQLTSLSLPDQVHAMNEIKCAMHRVSPFSREPVDCVLWVPAETVRANDYNPNSVAPPEMKLLQHSIGQDGYTQPIVAWAEGDGYEVVDGFHRNRVGKECEEVRKRVHGYLPVTVANPDRTERNDRIAATIRHNRARGKHKVEAMSDIVIELKRRNWSDERIGKELGMDPDEVLRLCQITGLAEVFANEEFSRAWDIESPDEGEALSDEPDEDAPQSPRIYHTWDKWECYRAGFYEERPPDGMAQEQGEEMYRAFLSDTTAFEVALAGVISEWKFSCEHYLTNERMNRIAWLGQASMAYAHRIPSCCRGGYNRLTDSQKETADLLALRYLNKWLESRGSEPVTYDLALSRTQAELY
jgi:ParB-like chromosome segregation protein Spo0J